MILRPPDNTATRALPEPGGTHVLVVDDDGQIRQLVAKFLRANGFKVSVARDGYEMREVVDHATIDLVILDVMLPGLSGLDLCRELRARSQIPIVMLTAKGDDTDRIVGLEIGADDYLTKPFNPRELLARINAVLRRSLGPRESEPGTRARKYVFEDWTLDTLRRDLIDPRGVVIELTSGDYDLLLTLLEAPQRVLTREHLLDASRNRSASGFDRSIDVQISRLRKKIDEANNPHSMIRTVRGVGYMFSPAVRRE
ncbi:response regulator [Phreatobacter stygius]|uniref:Regulatory protein VirG n=1 Tax=Phreatobacter stygius TaxID=1940610 RepID=A0A4D7AXR6_9HYPH|nr:response regulator transcription factor [Phreatobacter stygius]QCI66029.1 response regulator transcription factor [Phreatobacter stygius]